MQNNSKVTTPTVLFLMAVSLLPMATYAQCAMCRASLESNGNATQAEAVNDGIVYLMAIPYILVAVIGIFIYRMYFVKK
jgi:heme/copper-type cytochrome/quinol oxidase subunit 2